MAQKLKWRLSPRCGLRIVLLVSLASLFLLHVQSPPWLLAISKWWKTEEKQVTVLIWHWPFERHFHLTSCESRFKIKGCHLTANRELYSKADAVLIHHREIARDLSNLPASPRPPFQKWVWMNFESPSNTERISGLDNLFNLTLNYRQDANIHVPYGYLIGANDKVPFVPHKNKLVCWIVSNWSPEHKRVWYYKDLRKHLRIHTYGSPFYSQVTTKEYRTIVSSCKFYLAFENSIHEDYITEKVYKPLRLGSVPVVMGPSRHNYEKFLPGDAFIHVDDFSSAMALAKYLLHLDQDEAAYRMYFQWKRNQRVNITAFPLQNACCTCDYIRQNQGWQQSVKDLSMWYWGEETALERAPVYRDYNFGYRK